MIYAIATAAYLFGLASGVILHYIVEYKPLLTKYADLVQTMIRMKKQGFVPQFEFEQPKPIDVSEGVVEF